VFILTNHLTMAKKTKDATPNPTSVANRDIIQRLNFLYQASAYLSNIPVASQAASSSSHASFDHSRRAESSTNTKKKRWLLSTADLSREYSRSMKIVSQKAVVKMDPSVKRTICKQCSTVLLPGVNVSVRVQKSPSHNHAMIYTCNHCRTSRRIPAPPVLDAAGKSDLVVGETMDTDDAAMLTETLPSNPQGKEKPSPIKKNAREPPLFARNAGHVVFCGNERLPDNDGHASGLFAC